MAAWADGSWTSQDGLKLHYRDYAGPAFRPAIVCLPGLTRNARDFADIAARLAGQWRVLCLELRGRGESAYAKDPMTYVPPVYLQDVQGLIDGLALDRFVLFGTSLGGLLTMFLAGLNPGKLRGALLNDIGPVIEPAGLGRIRSYVGRGGNFATWLHAARALQETHQAAFPDYGLDDWLAMAKRQCRVTPAGRIVFDYDMKIAEPFRIAGNESVADPWLALDGLKGLPVLLTRGGLSDILSAATAAEMGRRLPMMEEVVVPHVGHAPTLEEPECVSGIDRLLRRI